MSAERMNSRSDEAASRERLSAILDGEATPSQFDEWLACQQHQPEQRGMACEAWHLYHLIGDVMRSDDLARASRADTFLDGVRERLRDEPVVMAPAAVARRPGPRRTWRAPLATAAGVVAVAGALVVLRLGESGIEAPAPAATLAQQPAPEAATVVAAPAAPPAELRVVHGDQTLIRDARLDDYLAAHKQFGGGSALGSAPAMFLRNAAHEGAGR